MACRARFVRDGRDLLMYGVCAWAASSSSLARAVIAVCSRQPIAHSLITGQCPIPTCGRHRQAKERYATHLSCFCPVHQSRKCERGILPCAHAVLDSRQHIRPAMGQLTV